MIDRLHMSVGIGSIRLNSHIISGVRLMELFPLRGLDGCCLRFYQIQKKDGKSKTLSRTIIINHKQNNIFEMVVSKRI